MEDAPGGGARFVVELPGATYAGPPGEEPDRAEPARGGRPRMSRILVVEDNANLAYGLRTSLELEGHQVVLARGRRRGAARGARARSRTW